MYRGGSGPFLERKDQIYFGVLRRTHGYCTGEEFSNPSLKLFVVAWQRLGTLAVLKPVVHWDYCLLLSWWILFHHLHVPPMFPSIVFSFLHHCKVIGRGAVFLCLCVCTMSTTLELLSRTWTLRLNSKQTCILWKCLAWVRIRNVTLAIDTKGISETVS